MDTTIGSPELIQKIESLETQIAKMKTLIEYYEAQFLMLKRRQFGASSERAIIDTVDFRQMGLFNEAEALAAVPIPEIEEVTYTRKKRVGKREEDLSGLPIERIDYELAVEKRECPECGETMRDIGADVRRELKLIPAQVVVVEHAKHAYACANCQKNAESTPIIKAEAPVALIPGSLASASLVAHIAVQKYMNGMPLYRLENGFVYDGVCISRQTMANWVIKCAEIFLAVIYKMMIKSLLSESVLHADETTVQVLYEPGRPAQSKSYEWVYRTSGCSERPVVIFGYKQTRKQEHPIEFIKDFKGFLHTCGY
jgi:transposase